MDYTISPLLPDNVVTARPELGLAQKSSADGAKIARAWRNYCCLGGLTFTTIVGLGVYCGLNAMGVSENRASVTATVLCIGPLLCTCCCSGCCLLSARQLDSQARAETDKWGPILAGTGTFVSTWNKDLEQFKEISSIRGDKGLFAQTKKDIADMAAHLDGWKESLNKSQLSVEKRAVVEAILKKMNTHVQMLFSVVEQMPTMESVWDRMGTPIEGRELGFEMGLTAIASQAKNNFQALESLLRTGH